MKREMHCAFKNSGLCRDCPDQGNPNACPEADYAGVADDSEHDLWLERPEQAGEYRHD